MLILTGTTAAVATLKKPFFLHDCHRLLQVLTFLLIVHILRSVFTINLDFSYTVEPRSIVFQGDGENKQWMRENDQSGKLLHITHYVVRSSSKVS
jgi:hypothetical protein